MQTLTVDLAERSYPIHIGPGLLSQQALIKPALGRGGWLLVSNTTVAPLYQDAVNQALGQACPSVILPDGEQHKTLHTLEAIFDALLQQRIGRDGTLIALGGGVVGDMAGFAAATYQRGIDFIQIPTTLLAQVDSSVGGKTAVNHPLGKNMIGAFHQPRAVLADTDTLATLPAREFRAGLAEVIKYGLLGDAELFGWLESNLPALLAQDANALGWMVARCCHNKARIVAADEREAGQRALLNLGHTFGHAIETHSGYGNWLHGEAVAVGMCMAAELSTALGWLAAPERDRAQALIAAAGLPTQAPTGLTPQLFMEHMGHDKKVQAGNLRLVLLKGIGQACVSADFDPRTLQATLARYCEHATDLQQVNA